MKNRKTETRANNGRFSDKLLEYELRLALSVASTRLEAPTVSAVSWDI
jgi:hypothetical protein